MFMPFKESHKMYSYIRCLISKSRLMVPNEENWGNRSSWDWVLSGETYLVSEWW